MEAVIPKSDQEVYRGTYHGSTLIIQLSGQVLINNDRRLLDLIDRIMTELEEEDPTTKRTNHDEKSKYMILARPPTNPSSYVINHLNIWLTPDQYKYAVELLSQDPDTKPLDSQFDFEQYRFIRQSRIIRFHKNGKVIAEDGYAQFASVLSQAITAYLPYSEFDLVIGQDEVGIGEFIGPLVSSSVVSTPEKMVDLQLIGVKDSKMVPRGITSNMAQWIRQTASLTISQQLNPAEFNLLRLEEQESVNKILTQLHSTVCNQTIDRLKSQGIANGKIIYIIDQYDRYELLSPLEEEQHLDIEVKYLPHAEERTITAAAASIMAKSSQLRWIRVQEKVHGITLTRKRLSAIRQHEKSHQFLKLI